MYSTYPAVISSINVPLDVIRRALRCKGLEPMALADVRPFSVGGFLAFFVMPVVWIELVGQKQSVTRG
jgi:hypothetical protein